MFLFAQSGNLAPRGMRTPCGSEEGFFIKAVMWLWNKEKSSLEDWLEILLSDRETVLNGWNSFSLQC